MGATTCEAPGSCGGTHAAIRRANDQLTRGAITAALAAYRKLWDEHGVRDAEVLAGLVQCHIARGEHELAQRLEDEACEVATQTAAAHAYWALADLAEVRGDHESAARHFASIGELRASTLPWRSGLALSLTRLGRGMEAIPLAVEHLSLTSAGESPYYRAQALRTLAAVDPTSPRRKLLEDALAEIEGLGTLRLEAQIRTDLAGVLILLHDKRGQEVLDHLRMAEQVAVDQHLAPLLDRVHQLLDQLGEPYQGWPPPELSSLTPSELRVVRRAVDGMTNRQIAEDLVVTIKAVEWHLSNVYRKLGIRSRAELPRP